MIEFILFLMDNFTLLILNLLHKRLTVKSLNFIILLKNYYVVTPARALYY